MPENCGKHVYGLTSNVTSASWSPKVSSYGELPQEEQTV